MSSIRFRIALTAPLFVLVVAAGCSSQTTATRPTSSRPGHGSTTTTAATTTTPSPAVARFVELAEAGAEGTFSATYRVSGEMWFGGGSAVIQVAQRAVSGRPSWWQEPTAAGAGGEWSYQLSFASGRDYQWIEDGDKSWDCERSPEHQAWSCTGPGLFQSSIGHDLAIAPFLPGAMLQAIQGLVDGPPPIEPGELTVFDRLGDKLTGRLVCLRDRTAHAVGTTCLTTSGFLASFDGSADLAASGFDMITLASRSSSAPSHAFRPVAPPALPFVLLGKG